MAQGLCLAMATIACLGAHPRLKHTVPPKAAENDFQVAFSASTGNADTSRFTLQSVAASYVAESQLMGIDITGNAYRAFVVTIKGRPVAGKVYDLGTSPEASPATLHYIEIRTSENGLRTGVRRKWSSTAGRLTVTAASTNSFTFEVKNATMTSVPQKDNLADGTFRVTLRCLVTGVSPH